ncbi:YibE/F family protein [Nocardioides marinus]|uniref:Putative membrane protein n=1 Tax=Nocardioides marinus TaxID=374514 RepID=A0A7Z0C1Z2_9ACTN|nr:YibE/F family protein [Nocardioides marinus]NYI08737.1 putative membrane protein [Nocardioides marinus]
MGAHHPRHSSAEDSSGLHRLALLVIAPLAVITLVAMLWLWPDPLPEPEGQSRLPEVTGTVTGVDRVECEEELPDEVNGCGTAYVALDDAFLTGDLARGGDLEVPLPNGPGAPEVSEGDGVVLISTETPDGTTWAVVDHQRGSQLWMLALAFVVALIAFGRLRGVTALVGLGVTFLVLVLFVVPAILGGDPPLLIAIVGSAAVALTVLYLTHGFTPSTSVAVLGTLSALALTGLLSALAVSTMHLTGFTDDLSAALGQTYAVNMEGLLLAGIVIGSLGVLDDVTVTQAATVAELSRANPEYRGRNLYRAGSRVGRSHIASVVNTIVLAYAGSSLPLLILIIANSDGLGNVLTDQIVAQEIVRSLVATIGLVAAVPVTTALAALVARGRW